MNRFLLASALLFFATNVHAQLDAPLPPRVAAMKMSLPDGFKATLFAGEPDVVQPIAFCFDDRGRLWVAECMSYPKWDGDPKNGKDRIVIFEEGDDGTHKKRTVFADNIQNISGINYGFGGVWVCATPNLLFIPIKDGDKPGEPEIVLDGWSLKAGHNVFNSLTWGPDGWLYGCNGIIATSYVGRPGTPQKDRVPINCGVWRYHPTKKKFEAVAHGTTNPWGLDFDEHGEMFITNCVIDHLWHIVPGGHYERMYGEDLNPHVYKLMPSICDHKHWGGGSWTSSRAPIRAASVSDRPDKKPGANASGSDGYAVHSAAGGGHAHVGCMIYLGDNWPARYRGGVFMCNLHGNRINHDILERNGSTYVARHAKDFMHANDPWFRGLAIHYGPDGGVYVSDWTDTGECHNYKVADKTNGRIFKITYDRFSRIKDAKERNRRVEEDARERKKKLLVVGSKHDAHLADEWHFRQTRRILQERALTEKPSPEYIKSWWIGVERDLSPANLRCLWLLNATGALDHTTLLKLAAEHHDERIRAWAIRLFFDEPVWNIRTIEAMGKVVEHESSPLVRLHLVGGLGRSWKARAANTVQKGKYRSMPLEYHFLVFGLKRAEAANDPVLSLMHWYALEQFIPEVSPQSIKSLIHDLKVPLAREFVAKRYASVDLDNLMPWPDSPAIVSRDVLRGVQASLEGKRNVPPPATWPQLFVELLESPLPEVRERALALAVQFGDERAFALLRKIVPDRAQPTKERESALKTLLFQQKADLVPILQNLLNDEELRGPAIRGLARYDHPYTPNLLIAGYPKWNLEERSDAIQTLAGRADYALKLLDAVDQKKIPRGDVNSFTIRQLQTLKSKEVTDKLTKVIGEIRPASADKAKLMAKYKADLKPDVLKKANLANGRALYNKACATCHRLFGEGSDIGPDLTGSQRTNLDYILENVLDPSAIVPREFQVTIIETKAGRTLSGIVKKESDAAVTLQLQNETVVVPKADIESRTPTKVSMMPDGAFEQLKLEEVRDLVGYLASPVQVALKK